MTESYTILIDEIEIGITNFEKADAPMGVVLGMIISSKIKLDYDYLKNYCLSNSIEIADDYPEDKLISTMSIEKLRAVNSEGIEIKGIGNQISGMDSEGYELSIYGIPYPFYQNEFPHHVEEYRNMFD
tara:strand:+ start:61 stop:444 length:384 start_codon:yes stop_codon:yes gene_type:complete